MLLAYALRLWPGVDPQLHASGAQTAFRFNSFIALALAERLAGPQGLAWVALLIALCVPLCNVAAVWPLARHGGHGYLREIAAQPADPQHRIRQNRVSSCLIVGLSMILDHH